MANFVTANIVAANEGLNSALDGLDALTSGIIGGILSIPAIPTALVTAQHAIMVAQIIKALPKLPSLLIQDVNLQAELITLATLKVGSVAYETAFNKLDAKFGSALRKDDNLFISPLLKGGRVSPQDIVDRYKYSESRRFATLKEMYQDIEAARTLGMRNSKIRKELKKRRGISKDVVNQVLKGIYSPKPPSDFFKTRIRKINRDLNKQEGVDIPRRYRYTDMVPPVLLNRQELIDDTANYISDIRDGKLETNDRGIRS